MSAEFKRTDVVVIRTGRLLEADMVANHLEMEEIPYYRRAESSSGVELAMPLMPVQGAGKWWVIRVPQEHVGAAREVVNNLPVEPTLNPGIWHYGPTKRVKRFIKFSAYASVVFMLIWFAAWIIQTMEKI
jgi:hypothetical protein